jgi:hypothetical protein
MDAMLETQLRGVGPGHDDHPPFSSVARFCLSRLMVPDIPLQVRDIVMKSFCEMVDLGNVPFTILSGTRRERPVHIQALDFDFNI